jgi:hypothetical protein
MKISASNTAIIINDYTMGDNPRMEKSFSIWDPIIHSFRMFGCYYDEENKKFYIPSGVDMWKVKSFFHESSYESLPCQPSKEFNNNIQLKNPPKDERQREALEFTCAYGEDYEDNQFSPQLSVALNTGKGKTYISIATIQYYRKKSIIITGSKTLLDQWESEILHHTTASKDDILNISGSDMITLILSGKSKKAERANIFLCTHGSLRSYGDRFGWTKIYDLFNVLGIGLKFFDEAHTNFDNMMMINFFTNTWKTYYVTATPGRSSWEENKIFQLSIKNVPSIDMFDQERDPHTIYQAIKFNSRPTPQDISRCRNKYGLDRMTYVDYVTKKPEFYAMFRVVMEELVLKALEYGPVLIYIGTNEGILRVYYWLCQWYQYLIPDIGIFTSLVDKEEKMKEKQKRLILSTTKSAGLGEHIEGLKMTVVLAEPFRSEILARQTLGRTRDNDTYYIELVDLGFRQITKFYNKKLPIFDKYAKEVYHDTIDPYEMNRRSEKLLEKQWDKYGKAECPIEFIDPRFDFSNLPKCFKKPEDPNPECPIEIINKEEYINPLRII